MTRLKLRIHWPYKRHEDLLEAGFRSRGTVKCPLCENAVGIYQKLDEIPVFVNIENYRPHLDFIHSGSDGEDPQPVDNKSAAAGDR